jgi:hypothetical protein
VELIASFDLEFHGSLIGAKHLMARLDVCKLSQLYLMLIGQIQNNFNFDQFAQFGYTKHAVFIQTNLGTLST